jgi:PadR family transcriptional regulator, regulatory protein PadR
MPGGHHCRRERKGTCSCEMGNLYRFAEPIVLLSLARLGESYGYLIAQEANGMAVTHAGLDTAVIYRTLHRLEQAGNVTSSWDTEGGGPARRLYRLTDEGWHHVDEWGEVLEGVVRSLKKLRDGCRQVSEKEQRKRAN